MGTFFSRYDHEIFELDDAGTFIYFGTEQLNLKVSFNEIWKQKQIFSYLGLKVVYFSGEKC